MALDYSQRLARARNIQKYRAKITMARKRLAKRAANPDQLEKRSRRMAVKMVRKIVAGRVGLEYDKLSVAQKMEIDKKVDGKKGLIDRFAKRLLPKVRQQDRDRLKAKQQNESVFMGIEMDFVSEAVEHLDDDMKAFIGSLVESYVDFYGKEEAVKRLAEATLPEAQREFVDSFLEGIA